MKKIGDIMKEMGFREDAPASAKEAFLKHLIKNSTGITVQTPSEKQQTKEPEQLSFPFLQDQSRKPAKVS
ncbi:MAG: hypothetical protein ACAH59_02120 [Pseudobdellovibrionaceae bacterium]